MANPSNRKADAKSEPDKSPLVKVRARTHLAELIDGVVQRFAPGEEFRLSARRAAACGAAVEILKPAPATAPAAEA